MLNRSLGQRGRAPSLGVLRARPVSANSPFTPDKILNLFLWYKTETLSALSDTDFVTLWPDSAGNGYALNTNGLYANPRYMTNQLNGYPNVQFTPNHDLDTTSAIPLPNVATLFLATKPEVVGGTATQLAYGSSYVQAIIDTDSKWAIASGSLLKAAHVAVDGAATVFSAVFNGGSSGIWINGANEASGDAGSPVQADQVFSVGSQGTFKGHLLSELILYSGALSTGNRRKVEAYLGKKYAITLA